MKPQRIQLSRKKGFRLQETSLALNGLPAAKVSRPGRWGNPFQVDLLGRDLAVEMFRDLLSGFFDPYKLKHLTDAEFKEVYDAKTAFERRLNCGTELRSGLRRELRGKNLACFCKPGDVCHADVLLDLANPEASR